MLVADVPRPGRLELAFVGGLATLAGWAALSALWSPGAALPVLEAERGLLYACAAAAASLLLGLRSAAPALLGGIVAGAVVLALYALATRLLPGHVGGAYDPSSGYQLAEPIGYWNALGILVALSSLLALGFAAHGSLPARAAAAVALVVLAPALYFTFSRGAVLAFAGGAVVQAALDPRRARLLASSFVLGAPAALAVLEASRHHALTAPGATLATAQAEGRDLAWSIALLAVVAVAAALALGLAERRLRVPARLARLFVVAVAAAAVAVGLVAVVAVVDRARSAFSEPVPAAGGDLDRRLLSTSGNGRSDYWRIAWEQAREEPLVGAGAGSYEARWLRERPVAFHARDAHNLYLETLAELGVVGLALLLATLALPLAALRRARARPFGAAAGAAFGAFLLHALLDWDWEVPAVTVPALLCATVLLGAERAGDPVLLTSRRRRGLALALGVPFVAVALVAHAGNRAAAASAEAAAAGDFERALFEAKRASAWAPWSEEPWQLRGEAELLLRDDAAARRSLDRALELNPESWLTWYHLALATEDADEVTHERALNEVSELNPLSPEADELRTER